MPRSLVVTDPFTGTGTDLGADWTPYDAFPSAMARDTDRAVPAAVGDNEEEQNTVAVLANAQYAEGTIAVLTADFNQWVAVTLRGGTLASGNFYLLVAGNSVRAASNIYRVDAGVLTSIGSSTTTYAAPDKYSLEAELDALRSFKNTTLDISATDATFASGKAGIGATKGGAGILVAIETWDAGDITAAGAGGGGAAHGRPGRVVLLSRKGTLRRWRS